VETRLGKTAVDSRVPGDATSAAGGNGFCSVGGGFTGLAAAAWLKRLAPEKSWRCLRRGNLARDRVGTREAWRWRKARRELEGLGDVLGGYQKILQELEVEEVSLRVRTNWGERRHLRIRRPVEGFGGTLRCEGKCRAARSIQERW